MELALPARTERLSRSGVQGIPNTPSAHARFVKLRQELLRPGWLRGCSSGQPVDEHVEAGGESLVAVVEPDVVAEGGQGGEAVGGQRAEEFVELFSGGAVLD